MGLKVIKDPDPRLRQVSLPVLKFDDELKEFMYDLLKAMHEENGIGIAAIQVGNPIRALIVEIPKNSEENNVFFIINPKIIYLSQDHIKLQEGCLSVRDSDGSTFIRGEVSRPISIGISYSDLEGNYLDMHIVGSESEYNMWFSRCLQHEIDHLDGVLFTDKLYENIFN